MIRLLALLFFFDFAASAQDSGESILEPREVFRYEHRVLHTAVGACLGYASESIAFRVIPDAPPWQRRLIGYGVGLAAGIAKELFDHRHGTESWPHSEWDIAFTTAGAVAGTELRCTIIDWRF